MRSPYLLHEPLACAVAISILALACRTHDAGRPLDAAPRDARTAVDAAAVDALAAPPALVATKLVASGDSTCAVMSDLTARCWGANAHGQLGNGGTADSAAPITPAIHAIKDLQLVDGTACALLDDASVACWGRIGWHGHAEDVLRPTGVLGVIGVTQIFVLAGRACARVANQSLVCWGNVDARGHFATGPTYRAPTPVAGVDHVAGLRGEGAFSDDGRMWLWDKAGVPKLAAVAGVLEIAGRGGALCGRLKTGRVMCAGSTPCAEPHLPVPAPPKRPHAKPKPPAVPADPLGEPARPLGFSAARALAFDLGYCVVTTANRLQCGDGCRAVFPPRLERVDTIVGRCAQLRSGTITCFDEVKATAVPGITHASLLAVGRAHGCALVDRRIACWGSNDHGQLGDTEIAR